MSEYAERDLGELDDHYYRHVNAMTGEKLHSKSAIAAELAWRDKRIVELEAANAELRADAERYRWLETQMTWRDRDAWHGELQPELPEREWFHITDSDLYPLSAMIDAALRQRAEQQEDAKQHGEPKPTR